MFVRLLAVGVAWFTALGLFAVLLEWSGSPPPGLGSHRDGVTALARSLNQLRPVPSDEGHTWTVTKATSALGGLVVQVDAVNPSDAPRIARRLVEGVQTEYDEVLVYVQSSDLTRDPLIRRIAWTPTRGYLASTF